MFRTKGATKNVQELIDTTENGVVELPAGIFYGGFTVKKPIAGMARSSPKEIEASKSFELPKANTATSEKSPVTELRKVTSPKEDTVELQQSAQGDWDWATEEYWEAYWKKEPRDFADFKRVAFIPDEYCSVEYNNRVLTRRTVEIYKRLNIPKTVAWAPNYELGFAYATREEFYKIRDRTLKRREINEVFGEFNEPERCKWCLRTPGKFGFCPQCQEEREKVGDIFYEPGGIYASLNEAIAATEVYCTLYLAPGIYKESFHIDKEIRIRGYPVPVSRKKEDYGSFVCETPIEEFRDGKYFGGILPNWEASITISTKVRKDFSESENSMPRTILVVPDGEEISISSAAKIEDVCIVGEAYFTEHKNIPCDFLPLFTKEFSYTEKAEASQKKEALCTQSDSLSDNALVRISGSTTMRTSLLSILNGEDEKEPEPTVFTNVYISGAKGYGVIARDARLWLVHSAITDCSANCFAIQGKSLGICHGYFPSVFSCPKTNSTIGLQDENVFNSMIVTATTK